MNIIINLGMELLDYVDQDIVDEWGVEDMADIDWDRRVNYTPAKSDYAYARNVSEFTRRLRG